MEDSDFSDWDSYSEGESIEEEEDADHGQQVEYEGEVKQLRAILNRLRELKEEGGGEGIEEKILDVEQTLLEYELKNKIIKQDGGEKKTSKGKAGKKKRGKKIQYHTGKDLLSKEKIIENFR